MEELDINKTIENCKQYFVTKDKFSYKGDQYTKIINCFFKAIEEIIDPEDKKQTLIHFYLRMQVVYENLANLNENELFSIDQMKDVINENKKCLEEEVYFLEIHGDDLEKLSINPNSGIIVKILAIYKSGFSKEKELAKRKVHIRYNEFVFEVLEILDSNIVDSNRKFDPMYNAFKDLTKAYARA